MDRQPKFLIRLLPLALVLAVAGIVIRAARSPVPLRANPPEAGAPSEALQPTIAAVNRLFAERWTRSGIAPAEPATDLEILRRLSLALQGTIPSLEEIRQFTADERPDRLEHWTRRLLADKRFADYFAERMARSMVGNEGGQFVIFRRDRFVDWLSEQLQKNVPYDDLVRRIISESGLWTGSPATNFVTAAISNDEIDRNKLAGKTVRAFLGQRIDCAQCHDHPFAHWKQQEFQGLAACYGQVMTSGLVGVEDREVKDGTPVEYEVEDRKTLEKRVVPMSVPFQAENLPPDGTRRQRLAAWVTHPSNRRFERAIVNRVWALLFGRAYLEPVDDLPDPPADEEPDLLDLLGRDFREQGCDLRRLIQVISATQPFRMSSAYVVPPAAAQTPAAEQQAYRLAQQEWAVFPLVRLRPEQVIGALFQSSSIQTIDRNSHLLFRTLYLLQGGQFVKEYGDLGENELIDRGGTIPQRLLMMNGELAGGPTKSNPVNAVGRIALLASSDEARVETAFLCCLTRLPTAEERAYFLAELRDKSGDDRKLVVEDLIWTLYNTTEFSWNH